jgi:hypothetical protein
MELSAETKCLWLREGLPGGAEFHLDGIKWVHPSNGSVDAPGRHHVGEGPV